MKPLNKTGRVTLHFGTVSATRPDQATARVQLDELEMESYWLPVGQHRAGSQSAAYWMPDIGERVLCALDESGSSGCIISGVYSLNNPPANSGSGLFAIKVPTLTIEGNVRITGDIDVEGAVSIQGSHSINGKDTVVIGSTDSGGDINDESGQ